MSYVRFVLMRKIKRALPVVMLVLWCVFSTVIAMRAQGKNVMIGIDENGTRLITASDDPLFKTELVNFIRRFVNLLYNFDSDSFDQNVGLASDLMSLKLWNDEKDKVVLLEKSVHQEKISQMTVLKSISKSKDGAIIAIVHTNEIRRLHKDEFDLEITFYVAKAKRISVNPWGMEIKTITEKRLP